jgi:hypothetical protein
MSTRSRKRREGHKKGGGALRGLRSGFQRATGTAGAGGEASAAPKKKSSRLANVLWTLLLVAAVGFFLYRRSR